MRAWVCLGLACLAGLAQADGWRTFSDVTGGSLVLAGVATPLFEDGQAGWGHSMRVFDGLAVDVGLTEGLKNLTHEKRPYGEGRDGFPSLHASASFEVAAAEAYFHPGQAALWYGAAALVAYSRIPAREHHWQDILAGAALGYACGQLAASSGGSRRESRALPLMLSFSF